MPNTPFAETRIHGELNIQPNGALGRDVPNPRFYRKNQKGVGVSGFFTAWANGLRRDQEGEDDRTWSARQQAFLAFVGAIGRKCTCATRCLKKMNGDCFGDNPKHNCYKGFIGKPDCPGCGGKGFHEQLDFERAPVPDFSPGAFCPCNGSQLIDQVYSPGRLNRKDTIKALKNRAIRRGVDPRVIAQVRFQTERINRNLRYVILEMPDPWCAFCDGSGIIGESEGAPDYPALAVEGIA